MDTINQGERVDLKKKKKWDDIKGDIFARST